MSIFQTALMTIAGVWSKFNHIEKLSQSTPPLIENIVFEGRPLQSAWI